MSLQTGIVLANTLMFKAISRENFLSFAFLSKKILLPYLTLPISLILSLLT